MAEVSRLKKSRSANKNALSGLIVKAKEALTKDEVDVVTTKLMLVEAKKKVIDDLNVKIQAVIDEDEIETDVDEATLFEEVIATDVLSLERFVSLSDARTKEVPKQRPDAVGYALTPHDTRAKLGVAVPKILIKEFKGDPTKWQEFSDIFDATIEKNERLSEIEKFSYLKGNLGGAAEKCIEGISLTAGNYHVAVKLLQERFGNTQLIIATHIGKLLKLDKVRSSRKIKDVRDLFDKIESHVRSLVSVGVRKEEVGPLLIPIVLERLPDDIKLQVSRNIGKTNATWHITEFMNTLKDEITARENCEFMNTQSGSSGNSGGFKGSNEKGEEEQHFTTESLFNSARVLVCAFCGQNHFHDQCRVVTDFAERKEIAKKKQLCFKCLSKGHPIRKCQSTRKCYRCKAKSHHTAICGKDGRPEQEEQAQNIVTSRRSVFLETVSGVVADNYEKKSAQVKILLDKGAQSTYIVESMVKKLDLQPQESHNVKISGFADKQGKKGVLKQYPFCVKSPKVGCNVYLTGLAVPFISSRLSGQRYDVAISRYPQLEGLNLCRADDDREIGILIGSDYYNSIVGDEKQRHGEAGELVAVNSKLGWLLSGPCMAPSIENDVRNDVTTLTTTHTLMVEYENDDDELSSKISNFWSLDAIGIVENEKYVYERFLDEVKYIEDEKRYQIKLPFKEDHPIIEDQFQLSVNRLLQLKKKLDKNEDLRARYDEVMRKQIDLGIIEKVEEEPVVGRVTYLPHFAVIREDKATTKLRVVYNGSAKTKGPSLNDCLYKGEALNPLIFEILLRFRVPNVAITADAEAAYLQILVAPEDRDYMRLLYFDDINAENPKIVKYRFTRVIFGATSSQFLLNGVTRIHAEKYADVDPDFVEKVSRALYVDDFNGGATNFEGGADLYTKIKTRFMEASLNFRKWHTNDKKLQKFINGREGVEESTAKEAATVHKVLGITWTEDDELMMDVSSFVKKVEIGEPTTKRMVLKIIAGFYDPIGFIAPFIVKLKLFFQEVWVSGIGWDEKLEENLARKWCSFIEQFKAAKNVIVPRMYCSNDVDDQIGKTEMIGFSDASPKAFGCCVYFRFTKQSGDIKVTFVTSKSRVAPIKKKCTLPRYELLGNLILSTLVVNVDRALDKEMEFEAIYCWTDSEIALAWINAFTKEFKTFVQNRVVKIRQKVKKENWFHCKSEENPADIITREDKDPMSTLWWKGPKFLYNEEEFQERLKVRKCSTQHPEFESEIRVMKSMSLHTAIRTNYTIGNVIDINRYNDLLKLLRVTAFVIRFITNLKLKCQKNPLILSKYALCDELKDARLRWIKDNQSTLDTSSYEEIKINLNLKQDQDGVIRSHGRLKNAKIAFNMKAPIFLNKKHKLAEIIVYYSHLKVLHRGVRHTLTQMRSDYWITRGRSYVRRLLFPCGVCKKLNSRPYAYPGHSDLPVLRFDDRYPFSSTGLDYLGPLYCYPVYGDQKQIYKAYMVLFTCAATRAVSLEVVSDGRAATFIDAFSRFVARRGCPNVIVSDNAAVFGADETQKFLANRFVEWKPILESAPWWGGMYERLVACVKQCIKKTVGVRTLTFTELQTVSAEIESVLNSRPIGADYDDDMGDTLTPNHLMFGRTLPTTGEQRVMTNIQDSNECLSKRKRLLESALDHFWDRWRREYVTSLRDYHRRVKKRGATKIRVGDVVIVFDDKLPRHRWRVGKVEQLITGSDNKVRGATLKMGRTGCIIRRPVNKLYPFVQSSMPNEGNHEISVRQLPDEGNIANVNDENPLSEGATENVDDVNIRNDSNSSPNEGETENADQRVIRNVNVVHPADNENAVGGRVRRKAAVVGELRRKFGNW